MDASQPHSRNFLQLEFRIGLVVGRSDLVRRRTHICCIQERNSAAPQFRVEALLELQFGGGAAREKPTISGAAAVASASARGAPAAAHAIDAAIPAASSAPRALVEPVRLTHVLSSAQSRMPVPRFNSVTASANISPAAPTMIP